MRLREIREAKGLTQSELARKAHLTQPFVSELENGVKVNPSYKVLKSLAAALGVSVAELLGEDEKPTGTEGR